MPTLTRVALAAWAAPAGWTNKKRDVDDDAARPRASAASAWLQSSSLGRVRAAAAHGNAARADLSSADRIVSRHDRPHSNTRFLVVGSGVAGLHTAWRASEHGDVLLLTKRSLFDSATAYAQGGIAAALGAGDSPALHRQDTLAAGAALCDAAAVQVLVEEGPARVRELQTAGAHFDLDPQGRAQARPRGGALEEPHRPRARRSDRRRGRAHARRARARDEAHHACSRRRACSTSSCDAACASACARASPAAPTEIIADATVLATGGCGQVYRYTTNPVVATGDGFAIAHRAGVTLADMEFVQFHPTALDTPENPLALISEAVRGEGAMLVNARGVRFMTGEHRLAELAPRDVVARAIFREQRRRAASISTRASSAQAFAKRFPGIFALCMARGIDPRTRSDSRSRRRRTT